MALHVCGWVIFGLICKANGNGLKLRFCDLRRELRIFSVCFVLKPQSCCPTRLLSQVQRAESVRSLCSQPLLRLPTKRGRASADGRDLAGGWWLLAAESQCLWGPSRPGCRVGRAGGWVCAGVTGHSPRGEAWALIPRSEVRGCSVWSTSKTRATSSDLHFICKPGSDPNVGGVRGRGSAVFNLIYSWQNRSSPVSGETQLRQT